MNLQTTLAEFANHSPAEHEQFRAYVVARMCATEPYSAEIIDLAEALRKRNERRTAAYGPSHAGDDRARAIFKELDK